VAVATLAAGIGANTAAFSVVNGVLIEPLPYPGADRIHTLRTMVSTASGEASWPVNALHFAEWRRSCASCERIALLAPAAANIGGIGEPRRVETLAVSADLFPMLGLRMLHGRAFRPGEEDRGVALVAILTEEFWRNSFGGDPSAVGRKIVVNEVPTEIVGVMPERFRLPRGEQAGATPRLPDRVEMLLPLRVNLPAFSPGGPFLFASLAKLKPGATAESAAAEMRGALHAATKATRQPMRAGLTPLHEQLTAPVRRPLWILSAAAAVLLLIVCVNLGGLLLARSAARQRDAAIRRALGAGLGDLVRASLAESLLLALAGGAGGLALAWLALSALVRLAPAALPRLDEAAIDGGALAVSLLLASGAGVVLGLIPLSPLRRSGTRLAAGVSGPRSTEDRGDRRARKTMVAAEVGLSIALAAVAGLLVASFANVMAVDKGFESERTLTFQVSLAEGRYDLDHRIRTHAAILDRLHSIPGVTAARLTSQLPLRGQIWITQVRRKGDVRHFSEVPQANWRFVSPGYFRAAGTALRAGRGFEEGDRGRKVAVISERVAREVFAGGNPIGQSVHYNDSSGANLMEVVGVVADAKVESLEAPAPLTVYLPYWHLGSPGAFYVLRAARETGPLVAEARAAVAEASGGLPLHRVRTLGDLVG
jgi:putative ABC transport system permease protein